MCIIYLFLYIFIFLELFAWVEFLPVSVKINHLPVSVKINKPCTGSHKHLFFDFWALHFLHASLGATPPGQINK